MNLMQLIKIFNFRDYFEEASNADDKFASKTIRVFNERSSNPLKDWFEIGQYDYGENSPLLNVLNKEYLEATISSIDINSELDCLAVWIDVGANNQQLR
ncbi:allophanate hydrolase [Weissella oryzae SG25]|uniref:Allophanate hydrolase n=1 Tax=Weissella oryzae (strain DSM 25784 / JCM 18191 / LMG 30913 / SG25) TaxID=1329250 RepID=A0A069CTD8_WEIOS|nr:hypothetical protein [Weissella oryzae]GAK30724.1 allophanate hydrolase [Weissella oryzae SG25]